jgi:hypothetical protein
MIVAMCLFTAGHVLAWYTHNSQFVWDFWKDRPILANIIFGVPCGIFFWYGVKYAVSASDMLWTSRFVAFSLSYVTFPIMTWFYLGESMFTFKTMLCTALAFMIIGVQIFIK